MRRSGNYLLIIGVLIAAACASHKPTTTGTPSKYAEDLSGLRPKIVTPLDTPLVSNESTGRRQTTYVEPVIAVNKQLDAVLDSIDRINVSQRYLDGFTIQVYSGASREEALSVKRQLATSLPGIETEVQFVQPNFRVKAGKYVQRLAAQKDYMRVRQYFPNAIVTPERIAMNQN